ncbi:thymidylate kinase [Halospina denitrificans]|uniref:Thymidylate kinase n=1 Tax=Halospina denitrificans TaxID=332522 RepID=A0A4R7JMS6_9GAMM|nr:dTMP kinase [Halospina denitrificans]TDT39370.1 thymidylate kinase [Halospina denitrificans]
MNDGGRGLFITFEGTEGVGKSTAIRLVSEYLTNRGIDHRVTREPGGTPLAEEIRALLLASREEAVDPTTELLLMFAARAQHLARLIRPSLDGGQWVLCDRFTDATYAYQGGGRNLDAELVATLEQLVQGDLRPDRIFWLDAPVAKGMERISDRAGGKDRFETERERFFERVRAVYRERAQTLPEAYRRIDAAQPLEVVEQALYRETASLIDRW